MSERSNTSSVGGPLGGGSSSGNSNNNNNNNRNQQGQQTGSSPGTGAPRTPVQRSQSQNNEGAATPNSFARGTPISTGRSPTNLYRGELGGSPTPARTTNNNAETPHSNGGGSNGPSTPGSAGSSRRTNASRRLTSGDGAAAAAGSSSRRSAGENSESDSQLTWSEAAVIWGTNVNTMEAVNTFREFIEQYAVEEDSSSEEGAQYSHYRRVMSEMAHTGERSLNVDCSELYYFSRDCARLYEQLVKYPTEIIPLMDLVVNEQYCEVANSSELDNEGMPVERLQVRLHNLHTTKRMRDLDPIDMDNLIGMQGMVIRGSSIIPDLRRAFFRCSTCQQSVQVNVDRNRINEPTYCNHCSARNSYEIVHNRCTFKDKQLIKIQETPESIPEGETPHTIMVYAHDDLVDTVVPGDRVVVTGIFRALPHRPNPRVRTVRSVYKTYVDAIHFKKSDGNRLSADSANEDTNMRSLHDQSETQAAIMARENRVKEMSRTRDLYNKLAESVAPSIWEMDDVKKGVLLQLFGGLNKDMGSQGKSRGEINVLLCGDPGTSKSQLLSYVHRIAPRGIYTSGKGSSAVGLTAYITKDPDTREPILESGALVLSDRGVCCIDEFDKMSDSTRSILHEVMEQQTVSIAKSGIICTLNARTSILASANPVESRYNPNLSVVENIKLPPTLLSRFDLIYLILDKSDPVADRRLAQHIVSLYYPPGDRRASETSSFTHPQLTEYISWAKANISPSMTNAAAVKLTNGYVEMRQSGNLGGGKKTIAATPRQLESLIRLAEAHARMQLKELVEEADVVEAIRLMNVATQKTATDPVTGTIDMDAIHTGRTAAQRNTVANLKEFLNRKSIGEDVAFADIVNHLNSVSDTAMGEDDLINYLNQLSEEGYVRMDTPSNSVRVLRNDGSKGAAAAAPPMSQMGTETME